MKFRPCTNCGAKCRGTRCGICVAAGGHTMPRIMVSCVSCGTEFEGVRQSRICKRCRTRRGVEWSKAKYRKDPEYREKAKALARARHERKGDEIRADLRRRAKERHLRLKLEALQRYGRQCACCGEDRHQFLTFDHSNGDGHEHRRNLLGNGRSGGAPFIKALSKQDWPNVPGLRTLCANCHLAIDLWGGCPHQAPLISSRQAEAVKDVETR